MGCAAVTPSCRRQCSEYGGGAEKAECSAALRGSRGKYKLASFTSFAQIFFAVQHSSVTQCGGSSYSQGMGAAEKQT